MAIPMAAGGLAVFLLWAAVVWATNITVDANCSDWASGDFLQDDGDEAGIPDEYDIRYVYSTVSSTFGTDHFLAFTTTTGIRINSGATWQVWYDIDDDPNTGYPVGPIGADRHVEFEMDNDGCTIEEWDSDLYDFEEITGALCNGEPHGIGLDKGTCAELGASGADLGIDGEDKVPICMLFENADFSGPGDDNICFEYDVPTAARLSSLTACSEPARTREAALSSLWPLALLSLVVTSVGGFALWKRKGLVR